MKGARNATQGHVWREIVDTNNSGSKSEPRTGLIIIVDFQVIRSWDAVISYLNDHDATLSPSPGPLGLGALGYRTMAGMAMTYCVRSHASNRIRNLTP